MCVGGGFHLQILIKQHLKIYNRNSLSLLVTSSPLDVCALPVFVIETLLKGAPLGNMSDEAIFHYAYYYFCYF